MAIVDEKDRDMLSILWIDDITKKDPEIIALHFSRVMLGMSLSPLSLNATIPYHLMLYFSELILLITINTYCGVIF